MSEPETWLEIGALSDIPTLGSRTLRHPGGTIALFRTDDDKVFALDNMCPHKGGPLSDGIVHGCRVTCPLHNWVLELETGMAVAPDVGQVKTWPVKIEDGQIFISLATAAAPSA